MIKILLKSIIVVLLLLILIPMFKILWYMVSNMLDKAGICCVGTVNPWGVAAILFTGLFLFFLVLLLKN